MLNRWNFLKTGFYEGIKTALEGLEPVLDELSLQLGALGQQMAALEQAQMEPPDTGDDWRAVRDAASPGLRHAVELYAACRAGEWSHPGGEPVLQDSGLDAAGLAIAAGLEEAVWRDMATRRMANSQAARFDSSILEQTLVSLPRPSRISEMVLPTVKSGPTREGLNP